MQSWNWNDQTPQDHAAAAASYAASQAASHSYSNVPAMQNMAQAQMAYQQYYGAAMPGAATPELTQQQLEAQQWQWNTWHQSFQQWQKEYGGQYQAAMNPMAAQGMMTPMGMTQPMIPDMARPPPVPPPEKPPPPPPDDQPESFPGQKRRPEENMDPSKKPRTDAYQNTRAGGKIQQKGGRWGSTADDANLEAAQGSDNSKDELSEQEKAFDLQFQQWEKQFSEWKAANINHPDKNQYREYEVKWMGWREKLLQRRVDMRQKREKAALAKQPVPAPLPVSAPPQAIRPPNAPLSGPDTWANRSGNPKLPGPETPSGFPNRPPPLGQAPSTGNATTPIKSLMDIPLAFMADKANAFARDAPETGSQWQRSARQGPAVPGTQPGTQPGTTQGNFAAVRNQGTTQQPRTAPHPAGAEQKSVAGRNQAARPGQQKPDGANVLNFPKAIQLSQNTCQAIKGSAQGGGETAAPQSDSNAAGKTTESSGAKPTAPLPAPLVIDLEEEEKEPVNYDFLKKSNSGIPGLDFAESDAAPDTPNSNSANDSLKFGADSSTSQDVAAAFAPKIHTSQGQGFQFPKAPPPPAEEAGAQEQGDSQDANHGFAFDGGAAFGSFGPAPAPVVDESQFYTDDYDGFPAAAKEAGNDFRAGQSFSFGPQDQNPQFRGIGQSPGGPNQLPALGSSEQSGAFPPNSAGNAFGPSSQQASFGQKGQQNALGPNLQANAFGPNSPANSFGPHSQQNTFGPNNQPNSFGPNNQPNSFGPNNQPNSFGPNNQPNSFGPNNQPNSFGPNNQPNSFGPNNQSNSFGPNNQPNPFGPKGQQNAFGPNSQQNSFGPNNQPNSFGSNSQLGLGNQNNAFGPNNQSNTFGQTSQPNTFGANSQQNPFGPNSQPNAFGQSNQQNNLGPNNRQNTFGPSNQLNSLGPNSRQSTFGPSSNQQNSFGPNANSQQNSFGPNANSQQNSFGQNNQQSNFGPNSQPNQFGSDRPSPFGAKNQLGPNQPSFGAGRNVPGANQNFGPNANKSLGFGRGQTGSFGGPQAGQHLPGRIGGPDKAWSQPPHEGDVPQFEGDYPVDEEEEFGAEDYDEEWVRLNSEEPEEQQEEQSGFEQGPSTGPPNAFSGRGCGGMPGLAGGSRDQPSFPGRPGFPTGPGFRTQGGRGTFAQGRVDGGEFAQGGRDGFQRDGFAHGPREGGPMLRDGPGFKQQGPNNGPNLAQGGPGGFVRGPHGFAQGEADHGSRDGYPAERDDYADSFVRYEYGGELRGARDFGPRGFDQPLGGAGRGAFDRPYDRWNGKQDFYRNEQMGVGRDDAARPWEESTFELEPATIVEYGHKPAGPILDPVKPASPKFVAPVTTFDYGHGGAAAKSTRDPLHFTPVSAHFAPVSTHLTPGVGTRRRSSPPPHTDLYRRDDHREFGHRDRDRDREYHSGRWERDRAPRRDEDEDRYRGYRDDRERPARRPEIEWDRDRDARGRDGKRDDSGRGGRVIPPPPPPSFSETSGRRDGPAKRDVKPSALPPVNIDDLVSPPGRKSRPPKIVIILRGPPGSGKSFAAKLIKEKEMENGGSAPRILCLDDYFITEVEVEKTDPESGRKQKIKEMGYEYEAGMEKNYRSSLLKTFRKTVNENYFSFIIVDCVNQEVKHFEEMWSFAKQKGFQVYICEMDADVSSCVKRNVHHRTETEIAEIVKGWEETPPTYLKLDLRSLLQSAAITDVEMEDAPDEDEAAAADKKEETNAKEDEDTETISKWEIMEQPTGDKLDRMDGLKRRKGDEPRTLEDWLATDDDYANRESLPGKKRVRWADLEEKRSQAKMRAIGFVVGQTDWSRMTDPTCGESALTQTKYI